MGLVSGAAGTSIPVALAAGVGATAGVGVPVAVGVYGACKAHQAIRNRGGYEAAGRTAREAACKTAGGVAQAAGTAAGAAGKAAGTAQFAARRGHPRDE